MSSAQRPRFTTDDIATWRREGVTRIPDFFTAEEVAAVRADFEKVFGRSAGAAEALDKKKPDQVGRFTRRSSRPWTRSRSRARQPST